MTITTSRLGPNSVAVGYSAGTTLVEFFVAMDAALAAQGWSLWDPAANGIYARCYRAPIADGTAAYKYMVLGCSTTNYMTTAVYESWNAVTHVGVNLAYQSDHISLGQQTSFATGGVMYLFASARYALFFSKLSTLVYGSPSYNTFSGCVEISRDTESEVPGQTPIFGWISGTYAAGLNCGPSQLYGLSLPRTKSGGIGSMGAIYQSLGTVLGRSVCVGSTAAALAHMVPATSSPFSPTNTNVYTLYSIDQASNSMNVGAHLRGRIYGLKMLNRAQGSAMDMIEVKTDSLGFYDPQSLTLTPHVVLQETWMACRFAIPL